jgi:metal transporter CNNM
LVYAGALEYSDKSVKDVMTPIDKVYMLEASTKLNFEAMLEIYKSGYTRIPVYEGSKDRVRGMLYVKDLILVDPDDEISVETIISFRCGGCF